MTLASEEQAGQILSQDARGRVLVTQERRDLLLEEYDRSGMGGVRFAQYVGIKYTTLAHWLRRRRRQRQREKLLTNGVGRLSQAGVMGGGLKRSLTRTLQRLEHRQEAYGSTLQQALTVRLAVRLK